LLDLAVASSASPSLPLAERSNMVDCNVLYCVQGLLMGIALLPQLPRTGAKTLTSILPACLCRGHNGKAMGDRAPPQQWTLSRLQMGPCRAPADQEGACSAGQQEQCHANHCYSCLTIFDDVGQIQGLPWRWRGCIWVGSTFPLVLVGNHVIPSAAIAHQGGRQGDNHQGP
jgi:hypothetical protein